MLTMAKNKVGRPRLDGERYPSGQRARNQHETAPATVRRMIEQAKAKANDPQWGEPLGIMYAQGDLTSIEYAAARRYVERKRGHDQAIDAPSGLARSPNLEIGLGKSPDGGAVLQGSAANEARRKAEKARRRHSAGRDAVLALPGGMGILDVLERVCVYQHQPSWAEKLWMKEGLRALAVFYGLARG